MNSSQSILFEDTKAPALNKTKGIDQDETMKEKEVLKAALSRASERESKKAFTILGNFLDGKHKTHLNSVNTILLKPVGDACNLRCSYCYETLRLKTHRPKILPLREAKKIVDNLIIPGAGVQSLFFHGGEPMLAGLDYYRELVTYIRSKKKNISLGMQTNGVIVDTDWAKFIRDEQISLGVSLDGPQELHDQERFDSKGNGTFKKVMKGINILRNNGVSPGIISVFTDKIATNPANAEAYISFFSNEDLYFIDAHPAFTPVATSGVSASKNVSPANYSSYMTALFDAWLAQGNPDLRIRTFEDFFENRTSVPTSTCTSSGQCTSIMGVDSNGCAVPCTRPFSGTYNFGNAKRNNLASLLASDTFKKFKTQEKSGQNLATTCKWSRFCGNGGCPHERFDGNGKQNPNGKHIYCTCGQDETAGYPMLYAHIKARLNNIL